MQEADVVIIGGGISGAVCFNELAKRLPDQHTVLLEARERFGGRTCSEAVLGEDGQMHAIDTGGQWIARSHTKVLSLVEAFGLELEEQTFPAAVSGEPCALIEMAYYRLRPLTTEAQAQVEDFRARLIASFRKLQQPGGATADEREEWDRRSVLEEISSHCADPAAVEELSFFVQTVMATDSSQVSYLFFLHVIYLYGGGERAMQLLGDGPEGAQALKVKGGMQQISERLVDEGLRANSNCRAKLGVTVQGIELPTEGGALLVSAVAGAETVNIRCQRVVLALAPPLILKAIAFSPLELLDSDRRSLYSAMIPGCAVKVICLFSSPFWRSSSEAGSGDLSISEVGLVSNIFETGVGDRPGLVCLITGNFAKEYASLGPCERKSRVLQQLQCMYGAAYSPPLFFLEKDWTAEQFSAGCFAANVGPSANAVFARQGALLREDILPRRILVAGTETSEAFYGYIEGGARSGEAVALSIVEEEERKRL